MEYSKIKIPIIMGHHLNSHYNLDLLGHSKKIPVPFERNLIFAQNDRSLLTDLLVSLILNRDDVVSIIMTSNEIYVSTCVSVTAFNYASISRQIVKTTKVAIIIHEYGYLLPNFTKIVKNLKNSDIIVIEDCAHVMTDKSTQIQVGHIGDYSLYSLPKILPCKQGGLLCLNNTPHEVSLKSQSLFETIRNDYKESLPYLSKNNFRRMFLHKKIPSTLDRYMNIMEPGKIISPYFIFFRHPKAKDIKKVVPEV